MVLFDILIFILVLGLLVFFHEMGHFVAAKACGVYVERFSLGMPPRVFGIKWGETDYCIGATPLGGYVKMAGQEDVPTSDEERAEHYKKVPPERWLNNRPIWERAIVFAAGPLMNVVLAVLLYALVIGLGEAVPESKVSSRVGLVEPGSPAAQAPLYRMPAEGEPDLTGEPAAVGWETGDTIVRVDGQRVENITDVAFSAVMGEGEELDVVLERQRDGETVTYLSPVEPQLLSEEERHPRFGIAPFQSALVDAVLPETPAAAAGLQPGDIITHVNGDVVDAPTLSLRVSGAEPGETLDLRIERDGESLTLAVTPRVLGRIEGVSFEPPLHTEDPEALEEQPVVRGAIKTPQERPGGDVIEPTGLLAGDIITTVNGEPATVGKLAALREDAIGETVTLEARRPAILGGLLRSASAVEVDVPLTPIGNIGVAFGVKQVEVDVPPLQILPEAVGRSTQAVVRIVDFLGELVTGGLSPQDLGGPVMIYRVTAEAARQGLSWLLEITAFISINLAIFNLLPLPVLDGGHLVFLGIEAIQRKPVSIRVQERVQQAGLFLIIGLFVFILYNDITRWIEDIIP
jgi:regulator of sigma E protease